MANEEIFNDYDSEPVKYCSRCYSLKIKYDEYLEDDYCVDCGCTDTAEASIEEWEKLYAKRYGKKFTEKTYTIKDSTIFKMSIPELKRLVASNDMWRFLFLRMYNKVPNIQNKAEAIILLFDQVIKDNRIEDLKTLLANKLENK